ncbi:helix-turn-helix transcriptional regulator [Promicromonospora sp. NPDC052451]|uniref:helix-turn-helix transcriptional regulator n=1 Tax=Promicromonospora sp. NPDC052451 TaxID=3364407 RepID=UPI0037C9F854
MIDRAGLADFLRRRRAALQPEDFGIVRGARRRTSGLRREEVAQLCTMSVDYYTKLERGRGPRPSEQMVASIARGLRLSVDERAHLFRLAGLNAPLRGPDGSQLSPGLRHVVDRIGDVPAEISTELGETLYQSPLHVALTGDRTSYRGPARSVGYRWFVDPATRQLYAREDHVFLTRVFVSGLRQVATLRGPGSRAAYFVELLLDQSEEFRQVWHRHEVAIPPLVKRLVHPEVGALELNYQSLADPERHHRLSVYTAVRGTESSERLQRLMALVPSPGSR